MKLRIVGPDDAGQILGIYAKYIETPITFEYSLPSEQVFANRIADISEQYPYIVCETEGRISGYAYATRHRERAAYQWNAELSVYIDPDFTSQGLGKRLYLCLTELTKLQGLKTVYGGVTAPNPKSEALHKALGFELVGVYKNAGYKAGAWHDVIMYGKEIAPYNATPTPPLPFSEIPRSEVYAVLNSI